MNYKHVAQRAADIAFSIWHQETRDPDPEVVRFQTLRALRRAFPDETPARRAKAAEHGMEALGDG